MGIGYWLIIEGGWIYIGAVAFVMCVGYLFNSVRKNPWCRACGKRHTISYGISPIQSDLNHMRVCREGK